MEKKRAPIFENVDELLSFVREAADGAVVLANGCFDPIHVGHIRYLTGAKEAGGAGAFLVVAVNNDESTRALKGKGRPVMGERDRAEVLSALTVVDAVLIFGEEDVQAVLRALRPEVHAKGTDHDADNVPELETSRRLGIKTVIAGDPKAHASTDVLKKVRENRGEKES